MCTVIVGFDPGAEVPLLVAAIRDEMLERRWEGPDRHWPEHPGLVGGRDAREGGTWLAAGAGEGGTSAPRVGAVLNGLSPDAVSAPERSTVPADVPRFSRGRLPLRVAERGGLGLGPAELRHYDPFHLLAADAERAVLYGWNGSDRTEEELPVGVSVLVNTGLDTADPRAFRFRPVFDRDRPHPTAETLHSAVEPDEIWGEWPQILNQATRGKARTGGFDAEGGDDPSSLIARVDLGGHVWATSSMSLLACTADRMRYAFTGAPGDPGAWRMVV